MNWVDLLILGIFAVFVLESFRVGFFIILADFSSFAISLLVSLKFYSVASDFLKKTFDLNSAISNALGFLILAVITEMVVGFLMLRLFSKIPENVRKNNLLKYFAIIPALGETIVLVSFFLILLISFPISPKIKKDISDSKLGSVLLKGTSGLERRLSNVFGEAIQESLTRLTIKPGSRESVSLNIEVGELIVDEKAELEMFSLLNKERESRGLKELVFRSELLPVARQHAKDMWEKKYFSHVSPKGDDVGDRLEAEGIGFFVAGENLALSPTTPIAHEGLMDSPGHRENILSPEFGRVGIGVIDNGYYGKMFVQIFTD